MAQMNDDAKNPKVDLYLRKAKKWREEMEKLRKILLKFELAEEFKWGKPCYSYRGSNLLILLPLKNHCALLFCKGALLKDPKGILIKPGENTQAARQLRFTSVREIAAIEAALKAYFREAIEAEKAGLKVNYKKSADLVYPEEFQSKLNANPDLKAAFEELTPGRQRAYHIHFSAPKQSQTRESRVAKCIPQILEGKGLNDDYIRRR